MEALCHSTEDQAGPKHCALNLTKTRVPFEIYRSNLYCSDVAEIKTGGLFSLRLGSCEIGLGIKTNPESMARIPSKRQFLCLVRLNSYAHHYPCTIAE